MNPRSPRLSNAAFFISYRACFGRGLLIDGKDVKKASTKVIGIDIELGERPKDFRDVFGRVGKRENGINIICGFSRE